MSLFLQNVRSFLGLFCFSNEKNPSVNLAEKGDMFLI